MRTNPLLRRGIAVVVIALLLALAFAPSIHASVSTEHKLVKLTVTEYKADGTIEKTIVEMPQSKVKQLREKIRNAENIEERLTIYKNYGLIPEDVTSESLRAGMEEKAQRFGLTKEKLKRISNALKKIPPLELSPFIINFNCSITVAWIYTLHLLLGSSILTNRINKILYYFLAEYFPFFDFLIKSVDLMDISLSGMGILSAEDGFLRDKHVWHLFSFSMLVGFVGYCIGQMYIYPWIAVLFEGYAAFVFGIGIPILG